MARDREQKNYLQRELGLSPRQIRRLKRARTAPEFDRILANWQKHGLFPRARLALQFQASDA